MWVWGRFLGVVEGIFGFKSFGERRVMEDMIEIVDIISSCKRLIVGLRRNMRLDLGEMFV